MYDFPSNPEMSDAFRKVNLAILLGRYTDTQLLYMAYFGKSEPFIVEAVHEECYRRDALEV